MEPFLKRCWANINIDNLENNINVIKEHINKNTKIMAAIKANAYGHGDEVIAKSLEKFGISWFAASNIEEALSLRSYGTKLPILILGSTPASYAKILHDNNITQAVFSKDYADDLSRYAKNYNVTVDVHAKIDTGMGRIGYSTHINDIDKTITELTNLYNDINLNCTGIFTHFSCASDMREDFSLYTLNQFESFKTICSILQDLGIDVGIKHCSNSAAIINYPQMQMDMVRPGIILYGLSMSGNTNDNIGTKPIMEVYSKISMIKTVHKGESVSYGKIFTAEKDTKVATITCGYADGYCRKLNNSFIIINGCKAPVLGNICMDQFMVDITNIPNVKVNDTVTIVGKQGNLSIGFDELASSIGTIGHELVCNISRRVPRIYTEKGSTIKVVDYLINPQLSIYVNLL